MRSCVVFLKKSCLSHIASKNLKLLEMKFFFGTTVFEDSGFAITVHTLKGTQTFKMYVILLLICETTHITSKTAGLTVLLSTLRKSIRCELTTSEHSRQSGRRVGGEQVAGKSDGVITYARIQASNSRHCPVRAGTVLLIPTRTDSHASPHFVVISRPFSKLPGYL